MICSSCGNEIPEGTAFCTSCGAKVVPMPDPISQPQPYTAVNNNYQSGYGNSQSAYPAPISQASYVPAPLLQDTTPITPLGYIGYMILFSVPLVGFIMLLVYGFGSNTNVNLKNFARAYLIIMLIAVILWVVMMLLTVALGVSLADSSSSSSYYY